MDDVFAAIREARKLMDRMGPFPVAIWVVDRPGLLRRILALRDMYAPPTDPPPMFSMGIPVREWSNRLVTEEEYQRFPWFVRLPGVWVQMSDHRAILVLL